jgi:phage baseplate assembly protein W
VTTGMNATTGAGFADEIDHIRQSIKDILTTPIGSRVMRRDYGSLIPELIDQPGNAANLLRLKAASIGAIARWERRIVIKRIDFDFDATGKAVIDIDSVRVGGAARNTNMSVGLA